MIVILAVSTRSSSPVNSQLATKYLPSAEKSTWFTPAQSVWSECTSRIVCGSRKSMRCLASAITMAYLPSGVK